MSSMPHPAPSPADSPAALDPQPRTERRAEPRSLSRRLVGLRYQHEAKTISAAAQVWNLSSGGIALLLPHPLVAGDTLYVQFRHRAVQDRRASVLKIAAEGPAWVANCLFEQPLSPPELRALRS